MFSQDYIKDFDSLLVQRDPFALTRFHDGEHAILSHQPYHAASHWGTQGADVWFEGELRAALETEIRGFCIGISPPCCTPAATEYYRRHVRCREEQLTFSTIFHFSNYKRVSALQKRFSDAVIIGSGKADIEVPKNGVSSEWDLQAVVDKMLHIDRPFLLAAGPCANVIIYRYWRLQEAHKRQTVIDVGAALDTQLHGASTRPYHDEGSTLKRHTCDWNTWKPFGLPGPKKETASSAGAYTKLAEADVFVGSKRSTKGNRHKRRAVQFPRRK